MQGDDTTMLMQQVREAMTVNLEMTDESSWTNQVANKCGLIG